jgi:hypothetical protein
MLEHAKLLTDWIGESAGTRAFRRHATWYTKGFRGSAALRQHLMKIQTLDDLRRALTSVNRSEAFPPSAMRVPRGKTAGTQIVSLPEGYRDQRFDSTPPEAGAEDATSGG